MSTFIIFPAIDLRNGQVVRLSQGDPSRQKIYSSDPVAVAHNMLEQGATWLHVINLDGAFGELSSPNLQALASIVKTAKEYKADVQFGGGLHSAEQVTQAIDGGVSRAILGSLAVRQPEVVQTLLEEYGSESIAVSLDCRKNKVMVSGWQKDSNIEVFEFASNLKSMGLCWLVYTDIERDGMQSGSDFKTTVALSNEIGLKVIASGGVSTCEEVEKLKNSGAAGAILGRALYEGTVDLGALLKIANKGTL
jgi:phosphoribosylformimino-5-aminoimidazole carboxamide ribotide isomerase